MRTTYWLVLAGALSLIAWTGAADANADLTAPDSQPQATATGVQAPENTAFDNPKGPLTLQQALSLGLRQNPELAAFSWEIRSAKARAVQAGLFPNPELETSMENFGGDHDRSGFDGAETTVQVNQTVELGGKRLKRKQAANLETELAAWDFESKRLDVIADISAAFWGVAAAQESLSITRELARISEAAYATVDERVKAGKVPPVESLQAEITLTTARIALEQAEHTLAAARQRLAATWGSEDAAFSSVAGRMDPIEPLPALSELEPKIAQNPDVARWTTEVEKQSAAVALSDAEAVPDVTIGAGSRYFAETDDTAFVMALSVPVPLFNRNQGGRQEARHGLSKTKEEQRAAILKARSSLDQAYQELSAAFLAASALSKTALPAAKTAYQSTLEGYREGKFSYPLVMEAQQTLFEIRRQQVAVLETCHKARIAIERLTGQEPTL